MNTSCWWRVKWTTIKSADKKVNMFVIRQNLCPNSPNVRDMFLKDGLKCGADQLRIMRGGSTGIRKKIRHFDTGYFNEAFTLASLFACLLRSQAKNGEQTRLMLYLWQRKLVSNFGTVMEGYGLLLYCHGFDYTHYVLHYMNYWFSTMRCLW